MNLSISNIAWTSEQDVVVYNVMQQYGFTGLEIAPTRIFPEQPYDNLQDAAQWQKKIQAQYGFTIPSMQSIWYGRTEKIFGTETERQELLAYTKKAVDFAETIGCGNLVFGCPKNRNLPEGADPEIGKMFFKEIGDYAAAHHTVIGLEANPSIYQTNYLTTTEAALALIREVNSPGLKLNLDVGTMLENNESADLLTGNADRINHVHISEPFLKPVQARPLHKELAEFLRREKYDRFVSIEMGRVDHVQTIFEVMAYVKDVFGSNESL